MKNKRLVIVTGISVVLFTLLVCFGGTVLEGLQGLFKLTGRMSTLSIGTLEFILLGFLPLWTYLFLKKHPQPWRTMLFQLVIMLILIFAFIGAGVVIIAFFKFKYSPLLPDYFVYQPFSYYWSICILAGIITGIFLLRNKKHMKKNLHYLDAKPEDAAMLSAIAFDSKKFWGYSDEQMDLWKTDLEITAAYISENKVVKLYDHETFIGFFALKIENGNAEIDHLWLKPEHIKQNYGREIFTFGIRYLSSAGFEKATLIAEPNATGFYEKMGGIVIGKFQSKISGRFLAIYEFQTRTAV